MKRIVVLGAGTGGTLAANLLAGGLADEIREGKLSVFLVGEGDDHVFQPANLDVAFKGAIPTSAIRSQKSLLKRNVKLIPEGAVHIDLEERTVKLRRGGEVSYDYLVLATGASARPQEMPGLEEGSFNFHTGPFNAAKIWEALQHFKRGKVLIAITSVPHKCPPSPNEAAFMVDEFFRKKGIRDAVEIEFLTPYPRAYPAENVSKVVEPMFEERGIQMLPFFSADTVDPAQRKIYSLESESIDYDLLIAIPPHRGADVIRASGIGDKEGWIPADKKTMKMRGHSDVFALGDATSIPISKSGVVAHLQAGVVAENLICETTGDSEILEYNGRINCPMETGRRRALFVSGTYDEAPSGQQPAIAKYFMKKSFSKIYWSALRGRWGWLFDMYFGETSVRVKREIQPQPIELAN